MPNLNRVMLMGNLTRDPELRYLPSNMPVVNFGLAINRRWRTPEGEQKEETTFVDCGAFGRTAEVINQYMKKGKPIFVEGRLKLDQWQDKESGAKRSKLSVVVESFEFVETRGGGEDASGGGAPSAAYQPTAAPNRAPQRAPVRQSAGAASVPAGQASAGPVSAPAQAMDEPHHPVEEADIPF